MTYRHPEAFRLLRYRCEACGFVEVVWNSRDGRVMEVIYCAAFGLSPGPAVDMSWCGQTVYTLAAKLATVRIKLPALRDKLLASQRCGGRSVLLPVEPDGSDQFPTAHDPYPGERYFRDGIPAEARGIMRTRIECYRRDAATATAPGGIRFPPMTDEWAAELILRAGEPAPIAFSFWRDGQQIGCEFAPGWPMLVVRGSDADGLTPPHRHS